MDLAQRTELWPVGVIDMITVCRRLAALNLASSTAIEDAEGAARPDLGLRWGRGPRSLVQRAAGEPQARRAPATTAGPRNAACVPRSNEAVSDAVSAARQPCRALPLVRLVRHNLPTLPFRATSLRPCLRPCPLRPCPLAPWFLVPCPLRPSPLRRSRDPQLLSLLLPLRLFQCPLRQVKRIQRVVKLDLRHLRHLPY